LAHLQGFRLFQNTLRIKYSLQMMTINNNISLRNGNAWSSAWSTTQSNSGVDVFTPVWLRKAVSSNNHCRTSYRKRYALSPTAFV